MRQLLRLLASQCQIVIVGLSKKPHKPVLGGFVVKPTHEDHVRGSIVLSISILIIATISLAIRLWIFRIVVLAR